MPARNVLVRSDLTEAVLKSFLLSCKVEGLTPSTIRTYRYVISPFVAYCINSGIHTVQEVQTDDIRQYLLNCQERVGKTAIHDYFRGIRRWFNWMIEQSIVSTNPAHQIKTPRVPKVVIRTFNEAHINNLLSLCNPQSFTGIRNRALILLLLDTGLRAEELANMKVTDMDFDKETIHVMGKGGKERVVRFGRTVQRAVLAYLLVRKSDVPELWFGERFRPLGIRGVKEVFRRMSKLAAFTDVRMSPHTFRHTFAITYLRNGGDVFTLQYLLGHSTLNMTQRYVSSLRSEDAIREHRRFSPADSMRLH